MSLKKAALTALLTIIVLTTSFSARNILQSKAYETVIIRIRTDGSVDPPTAPISTSDNVTYTLTDNVTVGYGNCGIEVQKDNIILDGAGYVLHGQTGFDSVGVAIAARSNVTIEHLEIRYFYVGLLLSECNSCRIRNNSITDNILYGIHIANSSNNVICENCITENLPCIGIEVYWFSENNSMYANNITRNMYGIEVFHASNNVIYHNNFVGNGENAHSRDSVNAWDHGYALSGNYWSSYNGNDTFSGPYQNLMGSDGRGDTPYIIDANNSDRYPLMASYNSSPIAGFTIFPPLNHSVAQPITFNASVSSPMRGNITNYTWNFGDDNVTSTTEPTIIHSYAKPQEYNVTLTILDSEGSSSTNRQTINIRMATFLSISTISPAKLVGFAAGINGTLYDFYGSGLVNQTVVLYYTFQGIDSWIPITSDITGNLGDYQAKWIPSSTGYFTIKAEWAGNATHFGANGTVTLSTLSYEDDHVFTVESNSTVSEMAFNATNQEFCLTVNGSRDTKGFVKVTVPKNLVADIKNVRVYVDTDQSEFSITSSEDSWLVAFSYAHSTHQVVLDLDINVVEEFSLVSIPLQIISIVSAAIMICLRRRFHNRLE